MPMLRSHCHLETERRHNIFLIGAVTLFGRGSGVVCCRNASRCKDKGLGLVECGDEKPRLSVS
jgi:hypothetical protein